MLRFVVYWQLWILGESSANSYVTWDYGRVTRDPGTIAKVSRQHRGKRIT